MPPQWRLGCSSRVTASQDSSRRAAIRASGRFQDQVRFIREAQKSNTSGVANGRIRPLRRSRGRTGVGRRTAFMAGTIHMERHVCIHVYIQLDGYDAPRHPLPPLTTAVTQRATPADSVPDTDLASGRKAAISRDDLLAAALRLIGPHRSVSSLSLREVSREAGIAPNSFYRQFRDIDELAVALIDLAGQSLRKIVGAARHRAATDRSIVRGSVEAFMQQLRHDDKLLHVLLREGTVGSDAFKQAVDRELT